MTTSASSVCAVLRSFQVAAEAVSSPRERSAHSPRKRLSDSTRAGSFTTKTRNVTLGPGGAGVGCDAFCGQPAVNNATARSRQRRGGDRERGRRGDT